MKFDIITIFPHIFDSYFSESILKRAQYKGLIKITAHDLRDFTSDKHRKARPTGWSFGRVDDSPYGGGPGMVLKIEPIFKAVSSILKISNSKFLISKQKRSKKVRIILFSTRGKRFNAKVAQRLAEYDQLILICGRYEGVDERVAEYIADEEISVGDFVLAGGELPAMLVTEAVARFVPGVLGRKESLEEIKGSYPVYTRPEVFQLTGNSKQETVNRKTSKKLKVPKVLLQGDHKKIDAWRKKFSL